MPDVTPTEWTVRATSSARCIALISVSVAMHFLRVVIRSRIPGSPGDQVPPNGRGAQRHDTMLLPSGLSPSVPEFHRLNRCSITRMEPRVADCHRRLGITPTPEHASKFLLVVINSSPEG